MHILSEINIRNFKSIRNESFELSPVTPLVGYNNAGKTNIIEAIKWLLRKSSLSANSFNNTALPVEVEGKISGISATILELLAANHRQNIEPYLFGDSLYIKRTQPSPSMPVAQVRLFVKDPSSLDTDNEWRINPTGIDQAIQTLFPDPIHIGAMEDSGEDVSKYTKSSTIGKLLTEIVEPIQNNYSELVRTALDGVKQLLDAQGTERIRELNSFDAAVNTKIGDFFPGVSIKVHIPTPEMKDLFSKGTIKVFEPNDLNGKEISFLGNGAQRSIQMALIRHLADLKREAEERASNTLLLIDEPELYLHPQAIEILRDSLAALSTRGYQVIFSTHSPFMITAKDAESTVLIRKDSQRGTYKRNGLKTAIQTVTNEAQSQLQLIFSLSNSAGILFSERVVLSEGKTEKRILPSIIRKITSKTLGLHKTALVEMGGSGNTKKAMSVLQAMDVPAKAVLDLDYILKNGESDGFLEQGDSDIEFIKNYLAQIATNRGITLNNGWPEKNGTMKAVDAFRILAREEAVQPNLINLKEKLLPLGIWFWKKGTIEDHLGNIPKNEAGWASFNHRLENEAIETILPDDYVEITEFINWMVV